MAATKANKIQFGLKNVHLAVITETADETTGKVTYTYGTPKALPGAVSLARDINGSSDDEYADDGVWAQLFNDNGYDGDLELEILPDWFYTDVMNWKKDKNGVIHEDPNVAPNKFALLYEFTNDVKSRRMVDYYCSVNRPGRNGETKQDTISPQHSTITIASRPRQDGATHAFSSMDVNETTYNTWYDKVYEKPEETTDTSSSGTEG